MKRITILALTGLICLVHGQDLSQKVTLDVPAGRAQTVFAAISKATGVQMQAAANLSEEVFVVSVHDVTVDDLMKRIAAAEGGSWVKQSGMYILSRDPGIATQQERKELAARAKALSEQIGKLNSTVDQQGAWSPALARQLAEENRRTLQAALDQANNGSAKPIQVQSTADKTPAARAIAKVLKAIDPAKLAQIGFGERVVFSTRPTRVQQSLPGGATRAIDAFVAEQQQYVAAYRDGEPASDNNRMIMINGLGNPALGAGDPKLGLGVGLLVVTRRLGRSLDVQLIAADPNLETIATGNYSLLPVAPQDAESGTSKDEPLKISDDAREIAKSLYGNSGGGAMPGAVMVVRAVSTGASSGDFTFDFAGNMGGNASPLTPKLKEKILNPEKYEPLGFAPGEAFSALGKQSGQNVVALLPDTCFVTISRQFANQDLPAAKFIASLNSEHGFEVLREDGWIVAAPQYPATARSAKVNRSALGKLLRTLEAQKYLRLDDLAGFALAQAKPPSFNDFDTAYVRLINSAAADRDFAMMGMANYPLFRFWGSLSNGQRNSIMNQEQIPLANFSSQQLALISSLVYHSPGGPRVTEPQNNNSAGRRQTTEALTFAGTAGGGFTFASAGGSARNERTIVLPDGITRDGYLQANVTNQEAALATDSKSGSSTLLDAATLGFMRSSATEAIMPNMPKPTYDLYRMARQTSISLTFNFTPTVSLSRQLRDATIDPASNAGPFDNLPAAFRAQVEKAAEDMKNNFKMAPGRQQAPPPARQ